MSEKIGNNMEDEPRDVVDFENKDNVVYRKVIFEPIRIGPVSTLDEMDGKVLQFQNKKLQMKLDNYQRIEDELQQRIEQLEKRQNQDETVTNVVNSYWEHLNTNVNNILTRYDDVFQTSSHKIENEKIASLVRTLTSSSEESYDDQKFMDIVHVSIEALTKILKDYDYVLARNEKTLAVMKAALKNCKRIDQFDDVLPFDNEELFLHNNRLPSSTNDNNRTFEDENFYDKLTACIEGLDSVSDSETSDGTEKLTKSSITANGVRDEQSRAPDDCIIAEVLDEIVDRVANVNGENKRDWINDEGEVLVEMSDGLKKSGNGNEQMCGGTREKKSSAYESPVRELRDIIDQVGTDNAKLLNLIKTFQQHYEDSTIQERTILRALEIKEEECEEWKSRIEDIEYENEKLKCKKIKIECRLAEALEISQKIKIREANPQSKTDVALTNGRKFEELEEELEMQRELTLTRSQELETLRSKYQSTLSNLNELEKSVTNIPDDVVENTTEYKCLQSQFSVLYNDTMQIKDQIEEYHAHVQTLNATFANKMDMTETEDLMTLRKLQADLLEMQTSNTALKREYQMLKTEFEKNLVANEQTGPLNREMRYLLVRLQKHNKHLKHEAQRYKHRYKQLNSELNALTKQCYVDSKFKMESEGGSGSDFDDVDYGLEMVDDFLDASAKDELAIIKKEESNNIECDESADTPVSPYERSSMSTTIKQERSDCSSPTSPSPSPSATRSQIRFSNPGSSRLCSAARRKLHEYHEIRIRDAKEARECADVDEIDYDKLSDDECVQDLNGQLKKAEMEQKELKLLLDMYRGVNRDKRENMELMCVEKKLKSDIEETKTQMRRILEIKRENRKKMADEDALHKIKYLEDQNYVLMRQINVHKQEEEALLSEMEVTNQAFEDMQEQNSRLIQQLREKDDANSKLMAERIKSNLLYKLTREENENLQILIAATAKQLDSVTTVMNDLEEKEQVYQTAINNVEREINLRQQTLDSHRKKALESSQIVSEAKITLEKLLSEVKESKECIVDKLIVLDDEAFKYKRLQEEVKMLRRRVERLKKLEPSEQPDIVLVEEVREYKEMLTCQSCKVRRKDAVLSKCFHVFCWECLRTRYETRQRKCPKCNATFGANDYHRLFFTN